MRKKLPLICGYLFLLTLSLGIPALHHYHTDKAIEAMRPAIRLEDGTHSPLLMPVPMLFLRWLGVYSQFIPAILIIVFALSFWRDDFARPAVLCVLAICQCAFTTIYALYSTLLLGMEWLHRPPP